MNKKFIIKKLQTKDASKITDVEKLAFKQFPNGQFEKEDIKHYLIKDNSYCFGIFKKTKLFAFIITELKGKNLYIADLAVDPEHKKKKLASCLLQRLILIENKFDSIFLHVSIENTKAIKLYLKHGFIIEVIRPKYYSNHEYGKNQGAAVMRKKYKKTKK